MKKLCLAIFAIPFLSGCMSALGTVDTHICRPYAGVQLSTHFIADSKGELWVIPLIVDFPLSLALDTVLLPFTATNAAFADSCENRTFTTYK